MDFLRQGAAPCRLVSELSRAVFWHVFRGQQRQQQEKCIEAGARAGMVAVDDPHRHGPGRRAEHTERFTAQVLRILLAGLERGAAARIRLSLPTVSVGAVYVSTIRYWRIVCRLQHEGVIVGLRAAVGIASLDR